MELIVAAGVSMIVAAVAVFAFVMTLETYIRMVRQYEAEMEMLSSIIGLKTTLSSAVHVNYCGPNGAGAYNASTRRGGAPANVTTGCVFSGNWSAGTTGAAYLVAMVDRDMSVDTSSSILSATGVYYQRPTTTASGAIYIDQERNAAGGWVRVSPVNAPQMYTRFTEFEVRNVRVVETGAGTAGFLKEVDTATPAIDIGKVATSAEFRLVMRYFTKGLVNDFRWYPAADLNATPALKQTMVMHYDLEKRVKLNFGNTALDRAQFLGARGFGHIHLFRYPSARSRSE